MFNATPIRLLGAALLVALLVSCGGGGDAPPGSPEADAQAGDQRMKPQATFVPTTPIPANANVRGMFSPVYNWPLIPVHAVLMPDGRVLSFGTNGDGTQTGKFIYDVWDPEQGLAGGHMTLANGTPTDLFCATQLVLPAGDQVFIGGGDNWNTTIANSTNNLGNNNSNTFNIATNTLTPGPNMNRPRWYATSTTLVNGETLVAGGLGGVDAWEVRRTDGTFRLLTANAAWIDYYYPRNFVRPDGKVVGISANGFIYNVNPVGAGAIEWLADLPAPYYASDTTAVMYQPGKVIQFGGESNAAVLIDISTAEVGVSAPTITATAPLSSQRRLVSGTLLADGKVLATGGSTVWNEMVGVNYTAEIWNPTTGQWTVGATYNRARLYHNIALLLPDGTVMVGGGGAPGPQVNTNFELYFPPYLFAANGTLAARPTITTAPTVLDIGKTFNVQVGGAGTVGRVVLVKTGSVTHGNNMEQRFVELPFTANGNALSVQAPSRAGEATPGFYMLYVLNTAGVPSVARIVRMNIAAVPNPAITPTLVNPGNQASTTGAAVNLQLVGADPNGDILGYGATNLPPGVTLNGVTGLISGAPTTAGTYNVVAAVSDGVNAATVTFTWTVSGAPPLVVTVPVLPTAQPSGNVVTFTAATTNAMNPRYKWDFGDGTPETAYSAVATATHTYTQPGRFFVTVTAIDDRNIEQRQTVMQTVYLASTANKPAASSNIALQQPATGNARLWVVNQDADTVSVFDSVTRAKLAEVAVGTAPRTLAVAPNGMVWVSNKQSATISVINAANFTISRTIALPRASMPFGVAMAPTGGFALVVLEGTGQVLKFDTATYAQLGTALAVGTNPRHVSINAAGTTALVSRFVTPPLPGEATAVVTTTGVGGQVLRINTGAMTLAGTTVLAHSEDADAENQGRGIPNYLGAAVISPDGTQAFVPSKQDNVKRGALRDGLALNFQSTVRAISSRIDLTNNLEDLANRIDHDNASMAAAAAYDPRGNYLFVALETSRQVAVIDAYARNQLFRIDTGIAPQGLVVSADGNTLFVSNFMSRTVSVFDLNGLMTQGLANVPLLATLPAVAVEKLAANVLLGKQFFYDATDPRLARDRYMSCASCHNDGGSDGRVWDLTSQGEGLRNTVQLRGRAGMGQGLLHWSGNFNEVQDFEAQIRTLAGGTGLMSDALYNTGTRNTPLGLAKAGVSADLDALAAYVTSLNQFDLSPNRNADGSLTTSGVAGSAVFTTSCASCHSGASFTDSVARNIGTIKQPGSGTRLGAALTAIDTPTLRDVWATAPYLHDGSAATVEAAVQAHAGITLSAADLTAVSNFVRQIGREEAGSTPPAPTGTRWVRLEALTEVNGNPWTTMAEFNLIDATGATVSRAGWVVSADSAEDDAPATNAIDGTDTIWHTQWKLANPVPPHTFTVNLGAVVNVGGFRYLPPQGANPNGQIANWRFHTSPDGINWTVVGNGTFANTIAEKTVTLAAPANQAPTLASVAAQTGVVGTARTLALSATDPDGDALTYSATGLPTGMTIAAATGVISGTPTAAGTFTTTAQAADGRGGLSARTFTWTITATPPANQAPTLAAVAAQTGVVGAARTLALSATDPDGDALTYSATGLPTGLGIAAATGVISGTPTTAGTFNITAQAADGRGGVSARTFTWTITAAPPANQAPTLAAVAAQTGVVGSARTLALSATDPDGDALTYSATGLPTGLTIAAATGLISGTPTAAGTFTTTAQAADGRGGVSARTFTWTISAAAVGTGLTGTYFNNTTLTGTPVLTRIEAVDFGWGTAAPGTGVNADNFSARWTGTVAAATTGAYRFRTVSDEGVRLWVNGVQVINNWVAHTSATNTSAVINVVAGQRYTITLEYFDVTGTATMRLRWQRPGTTTYVAIPAASLYPN
jgi:YVTN family beta-propeller protein